MPDRIVINDPKHGQALFAVSGGAAFIPGVHQCVARVKDGELLGGVVYSEYNRASIAIHIAGLHKNWINRDLLWVAFDYPFNQLGVNKIIGLTPAKNEDALRVAYGVGLKDEARITDVFPDDDLIITSMYRADCRWLRQMPRGFIRRLSNDGQA